MDQRVVRELVGLFRQSIFVSTRLWGSFRQSVTIRVFPNHRSLEEAVNRPHRWLRAWAMYDELYIQAPRTWKRGRLRSLPKLLTHELTHVLMYQRCCLRGDWFRKSIPFWFREGMASVTASQGSWRMSRKKLSRVLQTKFGKKLYQNPSRYLMRFQREAYSLAHWMFFDLLDRCAGERTKSYRRLENLLVGMKQGLSFNGAFHRACGFSHQAFRRKFSLHRRRGKR